MPELNAPGEGDSFGSGYVDGYGNGDGFGDEDGCCYDSSFGISEKTEWEGILCQI